MIVFCQKCGAENKDEDKFCTSCGAELGAKEAVSQKEEGKNDSTPKKKSKKTITGAQLVLIIILTLALYVIFVTITNYLGS